MAKKKAAASAAAKRVLLVDDDAEIIESLRLALEAEKLEVLIARDGNHTMLTLANDFQGDVSDFAMVVPVPTVIDQS